MLQNYIKLSLYCEGNFHYSHNEADLDLNLGKVQMVLGKFHNDKVGKSIFGNVIHDDYTLKAGDTFYFLPGVTIPRIKLKDIYNTHKVKTVRDINDANSIFMGSRTINKITDVEWPYTCKTEAFKKFIADALAKGGIQQYYYDKIYSILEFYTVEDVLIDYATLSLLRDDDISYGIKDPEQIQSSTKFVKVEEEYVELYNQMIGKELYSEDSLLEYINGDDAVEIDRDMFETISDMFNSSDADNHTLAMEIMANSHYKKSILYLVLLLNDFGSRIYSIRSKNHVNFKSLLTYLGDDNIYNLNCDSCIDILIDKGAVTEENMNIILDKFQEEIYLNGNSRHIRAKSVCFSNDVNAILNKEIIHKVAEDYVPVEVTEEPVVEELVVEQVTPQTIVDDIEDNEFSFF